ncbi:MAG: signal peptidase I [Anaerotignum sp.]
MYDVVKEWGNVILRAGIILMILFFFLWPIKLQGSSMDPTLYDGDIVLMSRLCAQMNWYEKGDIVVFQYNDDDGKERTVLKRIIATEGDHIRLLANGGIERNGIVLQEDYVHDVTNGIVDLTIPSNSVFVLGDNRSFSFDSRQMGVIDCDDLIGKVLFRCLPIDDMQLF